MLDRVPVANSAQHGRLLVAAIVGNDEVDRSSDRLMRSVTEDPFSAAVPCLDDSVQILADDGVVGPLDDCRKSKSLTLHPPPFREVARDRQSANHLA
jgi:hypothetical protein